MKQPLVLALDIGTSSVRAALFDGEAHQLPDTLVKIEQNFRTTPDGGFEIATDVAIDNVVSAIDLALEKASNVMGEIGYVASCSFWHSLVAVDATGQHTPVVLGWADTRSKVFTDVLRNELDETVVHDRTGARFHSSFWPAKLLWLKGEFPNAFAHAAKLLSFSDLMGLRLFDEMATSVSIASGTGIFDIRKCEWDADMLAYLGIDASVLPEVAADGRTYVLNQIFASRWPRLASAKWMQTIADGAADNVGAGCIANGRAALMVGTSGAMRVAFEGEPPDAIPDGLWCYRIDRRRVIIGGALSDGGNLNAWLRKILTLPANLEDELRRRAGTPSGITVLPFFFGERSTGYNEDARGAIIGLTASHDGVDILLAAMQGVAFRFSEILRKLETVVEVKEIVASGGALRESLVWTQIIADTLARDLTVNDATESSLQGAVLLALESIGKIENIDSISSETSSKLKHNPRCSAAFEKALRVHRDSYISQVDKP